jgi:hypothetical protein
VVAAAHSRFFKSVLDAKGPRGKMAMALRLASQPV